LPCCAPCDEVVDGMDVVKAIEQTRTSAHDKPSDKVRRVVSCAHP